MLLSEKAWNRSRPVVDAIKSHPFNQALANGNLALDKFAYYIEQDTLYLQDFARCHAMIAAKSPLEHVRSFLRYSDYTFIAEQEVVHHFFRKTFQFKETGLITPATLCYTSFLLKVCFAEPVEIAIAAILPCFWVYREVGLSIVTHASINNPFARWIETYAGEDFGKSVKEAIDIFDTVGSKTTIAIQSRMLDAFYKSTVLEWHFWNDAYNKTSFDGFLSA